MYYIVSCHKSPKFLRHDGKWIDVELDRVDTKVVLVRNEKGQVLQEHISGELFLNGSTWMVASKEKAVDKLTELGVYPFESKQSARVYLNHHKQPHKCKYLPA